MPLLTVLGRLIWGDQLATRTDLTHLETRIMTALADSVAQLSAAVQKVSTRFARIGELEAALAAERAAAASLLAAEDAEDDAQDQALADAQAATDAVLADVREVPGQLDALTEQLTALGADTAPAEATSAAVDQVSVEQEPATETPTGDVPAEAAATEPSENTPPAS